MSNKTFTTTAANFVAPQPTRATTYGDEPLVEHEPDDYYGRYGTAPEPTISGRMAVFVGHLMTAFAAVCIVGAAMLTIYVGWYTFNGQSIPLLVALILACVFLWALGIVTFWRTTLDEWAVQHDRRAWDALHARLTAARAESAMLKDEADREHQRQLEAYARLDTEYRAALHTIDGLRNELTNSGHRNASWVKQETPIQRAGRAIATAMMLGTSYSRDAICADGRVDQASWREAMDAFARHGFATQARKGGPWKLTAPTKDALLAAVGLPPDPTPLPDDMPST